MRDLVVDFRTALTTALTRSALVDPAMRPPLVDRIGRLTNYTARRTQAPRRRR
jgi:hypothetical protein